MTTGLLNLVLGMMDKAKLILEGGQELMPVFLLRAKEGPSKVIGMPWQDEFEKDVMLECLRSELKEDENIIAYVQVSEAWSSEDMSGVRPSEAMDRQTIVVVNGVARDGEHITYFAPVKILEGGARRMGNPKLMDPNGIKGPVANLFEDE